MNLVHDSLSDGGPSPSDLVALDLLLSTRSVTRTAQQLGVSQSAMSHRLKRLREAFGHPLLVGARGGLVLTPRAEAIAEPLRHALADLRAAALRGAAFDPATEQRTLTVAMNDYGELVALPHALSLLAKEAPGLVIQTEPDGDLAARLGRGSIDLAVTIAGELAPSLRHKRIGRERYAVALRAGHPALAGGRKRLSLATYCQLDHLVVMPRGLPGSHVDAALAARGLSRRVAVRVPHFVSAPFLVASSDLVTTLGEPLLRAASEFAALAILPPPLPLPTTDLVMVWHERTHASPVHALFRRIVETSVAASIGG